jgi:hypothetical protein
MVTTHESSDASPMLVSPCELDVPGVVIAAFGGILTAIFYCNLGSKYITKSYRSTIVDLSMGWVYR